MYFEDYGWEKLAMEQYARLERDASACRACTGPCVGSCPLGVRIQERTTDSHRMLKLA
jgi:ferredoxin